MNIHIRRSPLALAVLGLLAACSSSTPPARPPGEAARARPVATFEGTFDPVSGEVTLRSVRAIPAGAQAALVELPPLSDGATGTGPRNTLELRNASPLNAGAGTCPTGGATSWHADVTLQSFYANQTLSNVFVELTSVSPAGHEGCNSPGTMVGVDDTYGTLAPGGSATATWHFRNTVSEAFTFQGRIMAQVGAPVLGSGPEFDWSPSAIVMPPSQFARVATTTAQLTWNGLGWDSWVAAGGTIAPQLSGASADRVVHLWDPPLHYADLANGYWIADAAHGGNLVDTSGDFTVCAKVKPDVNGAFDGDRKVFVGKGSIGSEGWGLNQNQGLYAFTYVLNATAQPSAVAVTSSPEAYTYDYICGGRAGTTVRGQAHGYENGSNITLSGTQVSFASRSLAIGAFEDGSHRNLGGVYEIIFDSRAADWSVMRDIVDRAEGKLLFPASAGYTPSRVAPCPAAGTLLTGADGNPYTAPACGTVPLANDGTGLAPAGTVVEYTHPLASSTVASGFCLGVEVDATGSWNDAVGGLVSYAGGQVLLQLNPNGSPPGPPWVSFTFPNVWIGGFDLPAWTTGSRHTFKVCQEPYSALQTNHVTLYVDGAQVQQGEVQGSSGLSLDEASSTIQMGGGASTTTLSGARVGRVFACGGSDPASCN